MEEKTQSDDYDAQTTCKMFAPSAHIILYYVYSSSHGLGEETILSAVMCTIKIGIGTVFSNI